MLNCQVVIEKLPQINKKKLLVQNELTKLKLFDSIYFEAKVTSKKIAHKII